MISEGQVVDGKYRVVKLLGSGGMGAVYLAEHMVIGRRVALKVLLGRVAGNETAVARFEREAQAAGRIGNDHILEVFDFGALPDGSRYMVCEFLDGETLADRLEREQRIAPEALLAIARQLLSGLEAAHRAGVVHRDLKPENVFILRQKAGLADFVKIIDFGISKFQPLSTGDGMQMTATGIVVGTPCYLSPEQARGSREADARSDLYAVGVILYECVTGKLPFTAANVNDLLFKIVLESPIPVREAAPDLDAAFAQIIERAMARDPDHRFQSAAALLAALDQWAADHGWPVRASGVSPDGSIATKSGDAIRAPSGATRTLAPTPGTWADSQISVAAFKPQRSRLLPVALAGVAVLGGGLALALLRGGTPGDASIASSAVASAPPSAGTSSVNLAEGEPSRPPTSADVAAPPSPELKVPPVSSEAVKALLEPTAAPTRPPTPAVRPATVSPRPNRPAVAGSGTKGAGSPASTAPAPPPATEVPSGKKRRDFGY